MDIKKFLGLQNASPEKRYKSFINTVTDREEVWLLLSEAGYVTFAADGIIYLFIWPEKEFCEILQTEGDIPIAIEIHDFLNKCKKLDRSIKFMVFPTEKDTYVVSSEQLCADIEEHLEELE